MAPVLEIRDVAKRFGQVDALRTVDLTIAREELFALLGPSGSGKTTLLRIIAGLEAADAGRLLIDSQDVTRLPPHARHIGMVVRDSLLFPHRTVAENIDFPLRVRGQSRGERDQQLAWALDLVRLEGLADRYPHQLSDGQRQRAALARGLVGQPSVLLLDEPLANLDRELQREMKIEIRRYQHSLGIPFVYATNDQEEALTLADRIAVMHEGRIEQVGPALEVYHTPASRFVAAFVGAANRLRTRILEQNPHYSRLHWNGLDLVALAVPGARTGDLVDLFLKPERIRITAEGDFGEELWNQLDGRLRDVVFKGPYVDCQVAVGLGQELTVSASPEAAGLVRGAAVRIGWEVHAGAAFPGDEAHPVIRRQRFGPRTRLLLLALPGALFVLVCLILPLLAMVVLSFWQTGGDPMIGDWSLGNYRTLLGDDRPLTLLGRSLGMASVVSLICLLYAWPAAYLVVRHGGRHQLLLMLLIAAPVLTGSLLRVMPLMPVLGPAGLVDMGLSQLGVGAVVNSRTASAVGLIHLSIPFMLVAIYLSLLSFDFRLLEAARVCGASPWRAFWAVTWPLNWVGTTIGIVLVVVPTLAATIAPQLLGGPGGALYGNILADQVRATDSWPLGAAMGVVLLAVSLIVIVIVWRTVDLSRSGLGSRP